MGQSLSIMPRACHLARWQARGIILRDCPTDNHPGAHGEPRERGIKNLTAHIVKVDVDAIRASFTNRFLHQLILVIDRGVETEFIDR